MQKGAAVRVTELEKRIELVRERCFLTEAGRLFLELLLLAEWDPDLKKYASATERDLQAEVELTYYIYLSTENNPDLVNYYL